MHWDNMYFNHKYILSNTHWQNVYFGSFYINELYEPLNTQKGNELKHYGFIPSTKIILYL